MRKFVQQPPLFIISIVLFLGGFAAVSGYVPLETLPSSPGVDTSTLGGYLANIYTIGIGLAGVLAVLMIVIGGIQYIGSGMSPSGKSDAKDRIRNAIMGLLLALLSWIILNTINPTLV